MIAQNTFDGGLKLDISKDRQAKNTLRDAVNIELLQNGDFTSAFNLKGNIDEVIEAGKKLLAEVE